MDSLNADPQAALPVFGMLRDTAKGIEVLTGVLDFYDGGRRWVRANPLREEGRRCLISALLHVAGGEGAGYTGACHYLREALALIRGPQVCEVDLIGYNDEAHDYDQVRTLILEARALAQAELDAAGARALDFVVTAAK